MSARILVVDDLPANRTLLEARLSAEYFDVVSVSNGADALAIAAQGECDIILLDVMMPGMNGLEVCRRLKSDPLTHHLPVIMVTSLDQPADRVRGLDAGADDFLTTPIDDVALIARVKALARLKMTLDELRQRVATPASLGMADPMTAALQGSGRGANILLIEDRASAALQIKGAFEAPHKVDVEPDPQEALFRGVEGRYDLFILSLGLQGYDALRLCSQFRSLERTRHTPILVIAQNEERTRILRALDLGANDYVVRPVDGNELAARARTQLRRKLYADGLRANLNASLEMAVVDVLTGLNNRRFFETNFAACIERATKKAKPLSLMLLDVDFFKRVNDSHGHDAGDQILKAFAARVRRVVRSRDLICRIGGEEFGILMPDTPIEVASRVAERIRKGVETDLFSFAPDKTPIRITSSIGLAAFHPGDTAETLMRRADTALYRSKDLGRNRVTADAA